MKLPAKLQLANIPTPIQEVKFDGKSFLIKRDDLTGVETTGNKIRKLEYLLADAERKKATYIFTSGGEQSNHCRATVIASTALGFKTKLFLWGKDSSNPQGNLFLDKLFEPEMEFFKLNDYMNVNETMERQKELYAKSGEKVYIIPGGGSSPVGVLGYVNFMKELSEQMDVSKLHGILSACGSGGTAAGMLIGASLLEIPLKIFAVNVLMPAADIKEFILKLAQATIDTFKIPTSLDISRLEIVDGYSSEGYKHITEDKLELIKRFAHNSGIVFDPTYTGKAFKAYHDYFINTKSRKNVLFLHTGGLFGAFSKKAKYLK